MKTEQKMWLRAALAAMLVAQAAGIHSGSASLLLQAPGNPGELEGQLLNMITGGEEDFKPVNGSVFDESNVDKLAQGLAKLKRDHRKATPEMMGFVKTVTKLINDDMVPKIIAGHNKSVATLEGLMNAFAQCKGTWSTAMEKNKKDKALMWKVSSSHKTCRRQQQEEWKSKTDCSRLVKTKFELMKSDCGKQKLLMRNPNTEADNCHTTNSPEPYGNWLLRNYRWFYAKDKVYDLAKKRCDRSRADHDREKPKCDKKIKLWETKKGKCDGTQDDLEGKVCTLSKSLIKTCTDYRGCHRAAMKALGDQEPIIRKMVRDRKGEWRALKRIECLLGVFATEDGEVDEGVIDTCKKKTHSTKHLDIPFPRVPPRQRCEAIPATPCSSPFDSRHYGSLPKNSKAKTCNQCVIKNRGFGAQPTVWLTAEDYIPKSKMWLNKGSAGDINNLVLAGTARLNLDSGNGARSRLVALTGSYQTVLNFGNVIPPIYTICSLTRYTNSRNGHYRKRILNGNGRNWLHGHWMGRAGAVYYSGWKTDWRHSAFSPTTNWAAVCGKNRGGRPNNILVNGKARGRYTGGYNPPRGMMVNAGVYGNEKSDFAIAEIIVWDTPLTDYHMNKAMSYLMGKLNAKADKTEMARREQIVKQDIKPTYWLTADKWSPTTGGWTNRGTAGNLKNVVTYGKLGMSLESGYGATTKLLAIRGSIYTRLNFGNLIPTRTYTICSLARYTSSNVHRRKRILNGNGVNWLHGHWMGRAGAVYYRGWKAGWSRTTVNPNTNWAAVCATNDGATPTNVIVNGRATGVHRGGYRPHALMVNQGVYGNEKSDFAIAEIKIWSSALSRYHLEQEMNKLLVKMQTKLPAREFLNSMELVKAAAKSDSKR